VSLNKSFLRNRGRAFELLEIVNFYLLFNADFAPNANFSDELISSLATSGDRSGGELL
jgi:hypothetical protein